MESRMTPFELEILLHYYCHVDDCNAYLRNPPIWPETRDRFIADGLLGLVPTGEVSDAVYRIMPRGRAFVDALQRVPLPQQTWTVRWPKEEMA